MEEVKKSGCDCQPKILLVDDMPFNLIPVTLLLQEEFGIDAHTATNGQDAYEQYKKLFDKECGCPERTFKLIFMDIQMPIMDGIEATKNII